VEVVNKSASEPAKIDIPTIESQKAIELKSRPRHVRTPQVNAGVITVNEIRVPSAEISSPLPVPVDNDVDPRVEAKTVNDADEAMQIVPEKEGTVACCLCGPEDTEKIANNYHGHRSHVYEKHVDSSVDQDDLAELLKECFPDATILNDMMCNFPGCGMAVKMSGKGRASRLSHVRTHLDIPLQCPVVRCKFNTTETNTELLRDHLQEKHDGASRLRGYDFRRYMDQKNQIGMETEKIFNQCFPFLPGETGDDKQGVASRKRVKRNIGGVEDDADLSRMLTC